MSSMRPPFYNQEEGNVQYKQALTDLLHHYCLELKVIPVRIRVTCNVFHR